MVLLLGCDAKRLAAGYEDPQTLAARQQVGELRRGVEELFEVIEKKQELPVGDVLGQFALGAQHLGGRIHHECVVTNRGERDPPDASGKRSETSAAACAASRVFPFRRGP